MGFFSFLDPLKLRPKWWGEFSFKGFFGGVKADVVKGVKTVQGSAKEVLKGVRGVLTPTIIWLVVLAVIGLILFAWFKKILKV